MTPGLVWTKLSAAPPSNSPLPGGIRGPHQTPARPPHRDGAGRARPHRARVDRPRGRRGRGPERRLRVRPGRLDLLGRHHRQRARAQREFRAPGHTGGQRQRPVHTDGDRPAERAVHAVRLRPRLLRLPRRERHRHHRRLRLDPVGAGLAEAGHHLHHRPLHHQGDAVHPRLVRHRRLQRRRHLARRPRRQRHHTAPRRARRADRLLRHRLLGRPVLVGGVRRHRVRRLPRRGQGPDGERDFGDRHRPHRLDRVQLPGHGPQLRGGIREIGRGDGDDGRGRLGRRAGRRFGRPPGARPGRLPPRQLRQRLRLHPARGRPRQLGRHRPGLRRADLGHLRRRRVQALPGHRLPQRRERRRLQGGRQGQAGGRQEGADLHRRPERPGPADHHGGPGRLRLLRLEDHRHLWAGRSRHRLRGPLAVPGHERHGLQEPHHTRDRQPHLRAEDPEGQVRLLVRADHGAGDLLRAERLPVLRHRQVGRPGPALRRVPPGDLRPARRPHPAARPGLQLRPDHGPGQPVPLHGRRRLPHRHDRHAAHRLPGGRRPEQRLPAAAPRPGGDRHAGLHQRGQRLRGPRRGHQDPGLPDEEDELRLVHHPRHLAGPARPDDLVDQLGPLLELGVPEDVRRLLRLTPGTAASAVSSTALRHQLASTSSGQW
ncbi:hypothetical protein SGPA1_11381 [Streptomyces misionensis JCM 4497]